MNAANSQSAQRIVILGHGAMGTVFGAALRRAGHNVVFLGRASSETEVAAPKEIEYFRLDGSADRVRIDVVDVEHEPTAVTDANLVIVLVKAPDTANATERISPYLSNTTPVLTLQNGLRAADRIRDVIGGELCVIAGVTSQAATRISSRLVVQTGSGPTRIGTDDARAFSAATSIANLLSEAGVPTDVVESIDRVIWEKAAVNAAINGLTALCGVANGAIAVDPELRALAIEVAKETARVAATQGILLPETGHAVIETATATAKNRSSMLQDIEAGRTTEADAIYGEIQRAARLNGIATPRIDALLALINARTCAAGAKGRCIERVE